MLPIIGAMVGVSVVTVAMILMTGAHLHYAHMALAALVALLMAFVALSDNQKHLKAGAAATQVAGRNAIFMALVWIWGVVMLAITYGFILSWKEWWQFLIAFAIAGGVSLIFAFLLLRDTSSGDDNSILKLARYLAVVQLVGSLVAVVGLLVDGKMTRFTNPRYTDWAANNVFFFGAVALAVISYLALRSNAKAVD